MTFTTMFIRMLTMVPVVLSVFWTVLSQTGLLVAVLASWGAIVVAEASIWERLRTRVIGVGSVLVWCVLYVVQHVVLDWSLVAHLVGPVMTLWLDTILWAGLGLGSVVLLSTAIVFFSKSFPSCFCTSSLPSCTQ